jgi:hypothetical protein
MPLPPPQPPIAPNPALPDSTSLQARIASLEARLQALEAVFSQSADGLTITSRGNIVLDASKDVFISAERNMSVEARGAGQFTIWKDLKIEAGHELWIKAEDRYHFDCGNVVIDAKKSGSLDIKGNRVTIEGSSDLAMKGSKVRQN